jgi:hypothetical protein
MTNKLDPKTNDELAEILGLEYIGEENGGVGWDYYATDPETGERTEVNTGKELLDSVLAWHNRQTLTLLEELIGADEQPPKGNLTRIGEQVKHAVNGRNALRAELRAKLQAKIEEVQGDE